jgi:hypothetical protein
MSWNGRITAPPVQSRFLPPFSDASKLPDKANGVPTPKRTDRTAPHPPVIPSPDWKNPLKLDQDSWFIKILFTFSKNFIFQ